MREEVRTHERLAELAAKQHGVVARRQMLRLGYSKSAVGRAASEGRLYRIHHGIYAVGHRRLTTRGRCMAAVLACGRRALLSHGSAGWLYGLLPTSPFPPSRHGAQPRHHRPSIRLHHAPALAPQDRATRDAIPVTSVPRTMLDLAAALSPRRIEHALEQAERLELFDLGAVDSLLARTRGHPGNGSLRRVLAAHREPAFTRSELERRFLELVRQAGLPRPSVNFFIAGYEIDMYWPPERFGVELDGFESTARGRPSSAIGGAIGGPEDGWDRDRLADV